MPYLFARPTFNATHQLPLTSHAPTRLVFVAIARFGTLGDIYCPRDLRTGEPRGFAFVRFMDQRDADDAIDRMDGEFFAGRELRIQVRRLVDRASRILSLPAFAPRSFSVFCSALVRVDS